VVAVAVLIGLPALVVLGLLARDDTPADHRELLPGVSIDLRTAQTALGPVQYDMFGTTGPGVLSVHAGLGGADQGRLFAGWLQDDGFRILSPSRPGYLGTPLSSGRTVDEQADLLAALLDELGISRVGVLAVSAGGPVAYTFAARHPDRVWALVAVGAQSMPKPGPEPGTSARTVFMDTVGDKLVRLTAAFSLWSVVASTLDETSSFTDEQKAQRTDHVVNTPEVRELFVAMLDTTFPYDLRTDGTRNDATQLRTMGPLPLERITAPALIVHATQDADVPFENGVNADEHVPGTQRFWMEQDDHLGFWLSPAAPSAQDVVRDFLLQHSPG
jgi:pimeloyl-ACP methyl ester carboxylesterase